MQIFMNSWKNEWKFNTNIVNGYQEMEIKLYRVFMVVFILDGPRIKMCVATKCYT